MPPISDVEATRALAHWRDSGDFFCAQICENYLAAVRYGALQERNAARVRQPTNVGNDGALHFGLAERPYRCRSARSLWMQKKFVHVFHAVKKQGGFRSIDIEPPALRGHHKEAPVRR